MLLNKFLLEIFSPIGVHDTSVSFYYPKSSFSATLMVLLLKLYYSSGSSGLLHNHILTCDSATNTATTPKSEAHPLLLNLTPRVFTWYFFKNHCIVLNVQNRYSLLVNLAKGLRISLVNQKSCLFPLGVSSYGNLSDVLGWF